MLPPDIKGLICEISVYIFQAAFSKAVKYLQCLRKNSHIEGLIIQKEAVAQRDFVKNVFLKID